jgi:hypothetical protein
MMRVAAGSDTPLRDTLGVCALFSAGNEAAVFSNAEEVPADNGVSDSTWTLPACNDA